MTPCYELPREAIAWDSTLPQPTQHVL